MTDGDTMLEKDATTAVASPERVALLYLDVDDEITSVASRLRAATAERVAVVLPYGSRLATSRINFRLLAREAAVRGLRIEVVAGDASVRALAASAGLPVHASVAAFEAGGHADPAAPAAAAGTAAAVGAARSFSEIGPPPEDGTETRSLVVPRASDRVPIVGRQKPSRRPPIAAGILVAIVAVGLVAGLAGFLLLPSATIVLNPRSEPIGPLSLTVEARPDVTQPDAANLAIPARSYDFPLAAVGTFQATGKKVTETPASGTVTFANYDTGSSNQIPAGSIVGTEQGVAFRTLERAALGRAKIEFFINVKPTFDSVPVVAVAPGTAGNVSANTIVVVPPGEDATVLKVTNQQPTTGGTHDETPEITQSDVDAGFAELNQQLATQLDERLAAAAGVPSGTTLFPATKKIGDPTPSVDRKKLVGQNVADFDLGLTATGSVLGVDPSALQTIAAERLRSKVDEAAGWQLVPETVSVQIGTAGVLGGTVSFPVSVSATRVRVIDRDALVEQLRGVGLPEARSRLGALGDVQITLWPDWVTSIPGDPNRITLTIATPQAAPSPSGSPARSDGPGPTVPFVTSPPSTAAPSSTSP